MGMAVQGFKSLKRKIVLPLIAVLIMLLCAALYVTHLLAESQLEQQLHKRASLIAHMVNYAGESVSHGGELQRIVTALGAEAEVLDIVVAGGEPLTVIASTRNIWRGKLLSELPAEEFSADLLKAITLQGAHSHFNPAEQLYDYSTPLLLSNIAGGRGGFIAGSVMVHIDVKPISAQVRGLTVKMSIVFVLVIILISLIAYMLLNRLILKPLNNIDALIKNDVSRNDIELWCNVKTHDEIGRLAELLYAELERADTAVHKLELQKDELLHSEERYRLMAEYSSDIIFRAAVDGILVYVSPAVETMLGYESGLLVGRSLLELVHPDEQDEAQASFAIMTSTWQLHTLTCRFLGVEGQYHWMETSLRCVQHQSESGVKEVVGVARDVTLRKHTEAILEKTTRLLGNVLDSASEVSIVATDVTGMITVFNHGAERLLGYKAEEVIAKSTPAIFHLEDEVVKRGQELSVKLGYAVNGFRTFVELPERQGVEQREWTYVAKSGKHVPVSLVVTPMRARDGAISGYLGIAQDISLRIAAERALKEQVHHTQAVLDNMIDGIITIDAKGMIDSINPAVEHIFGYAAQELIGRNVRILMPTPHREQHDDYLRQYQRTRKAKIIGIGREVEGQRKDGSTFPMDLAISEITRQGKTMYVGMVRDITERKRVEKMKSEFVSTVSHELRTPMNAILGFTQLMAYDKNITDKQKNNLNKVKKAGEHLLSIINDMLDLSRIEAGKITLAMESVAIGPVLEECLGLLQAQANNRGIQLHIDCTQVSNRRVHADRTRFRQVLLNLMSNAVKYNHSGGNVWVKVIPEGLEKIRFNVRDDGPGISKAKQSDLFQPFNRLGAECSEIEGTGIGLTITRQLVELMHGEIGLISASGEGSTFWFELEQDLSEINNDSHYDLAQPHEVASHHGQYRVLYIEDNPVNLEFVQALCAQFWPHMQLLSASSAEIGLELAAAQQPQLILMDINLPGMDGYEALATLQADSSLCHIPVVAVTANAMPSNIERGRAAGFIDYLTKPIDIPKFLGVIDRLLSQTGDLAPVVPGNTRLLLAEDNIVNQEIARGMLEMLGYVVDIVVDGRAAFEAAERTHYAAILMDCEMPIMNGYMATAAIRKLEGAGRHTPIIAVTAHAPEEDLNQQQAAGMDDYLGKPLQLDMVKTVLVRWVKHNSNTIALLPISANSAEVLDTHTCRQLQSILGARAIPIIDALFQDMPMHLELLRAAIERGDVTAIRMEAHTMKGSSSNLGATHFAALCTQISEHCKAGELPRLPDTYNALIQEFHQRVKPALEQFKQSLTYRQTAN